MLGVLDHPLAQGADRQALKDELADIAYKGRIDDHARLEAAVRRVFEPSSVFRRPLRRAVGHPAAPVTADGVVGLLTARAAAAVAIKHDRITATDMQQARQMYLASRADYAALLAELDAQSFRPYSDLYSRGGLQEQVDNCGLDLLTLLGLLKQRSS